MQVNVTGHHVDVTPALRDYTLDKLQKLERHFDHVTNVHVVLSVEKLQQKAEATVHITGADLFADAIDEAIDALVDKLDRQIKRHKEKLTDHHRR